MSRLVFYQDGCFYEPEESDSIRPGDLAKGNGQEGIVVEVQAETLIVKKKGVDKKSNWSRSDCLIFPKIRPEDVLNVPRKERFSAILSKRLHSDLLGGDLALPIQRLNAAFRIENITIEEAYSRISSHKCRDDLELILEDTTVTLYEHEKSILLHESIQHSLAKGQWFWVSPQVLERIETFSFSLEAGEKSFLDFVELESVIPDAAYQNILKLTEDVQESWDETYFE
ncbi:hypothetical protein ACFYKX_11120 [Cytobacillus sp. FJAT-54145]|uniref:Uncharacterized protein n=1 Tax=Cytobacillus spartinae TaxID=3299023 RepID=A0ABW6KE27_9BACI